MFLYIPLKERLFAPELGHYTSCGILVLERTDEGFVYHTFVSDVYTDCKAVCKLTALCNREQLCPVHLMDVIEDFLCS